LDGQGGAYGHQLDGALGRFARLNANLSWEYDTLADVPNWESQAGGTNTWTFGVRNRPRSIFIESAGDQFGDYAGFLAGSILSYESLGGFRITFSSLDFNPVGDNDYTRLGITTQRADENVLGGNSIIANLRGGGAVNEIYGIENGTLSTGDGFNFDFTQNPDITLEYDGAEVRVFVDGQQKDSVSYSVNADFRPIIQLTSSNSSTDTEVEQVTAEPLPEVLQ
jgi:hypothetical protein